MLDALTQKLKLLQDKKEEIYSNFNQREQNLVNGLLLLLVVAVLYFIFWLPAYEYKSNATDGYRNEKELNLWMQSKAPLVKGRFSGAGTQSLTKSLLSVVNETSKSYGVVLQGAKPQGNDNLRISLNNVSFSSLLSWVNYLYVTYGIQISNINIDKEDKPGKVRVNLVLSK